MVRKINLTLCKVVCFYHQMHNFATNLLYYTMPLAGLARFGQFWTSYCTLPWDLGLYMGYSNVTAVRNWEASRAECLTMDSSAGREVGTKTQ
jgi:hypothetical protein